jgi:serine/threonine protein kinase
MIAPASRKLGKYEILRKLGRGGMADVYLAQDTEANRTVALKLIERSADADSHDAIEAERRGAELQKRLSMVESHVVGVFEYGDVESFFFVSME